MGDARQMERPKEGETQGRGDPGQGRLRVKSSRLPGYPPSGVSVDGTAVRIRISSVFSSPPKDLGPHPKSAFSLELHRAASACRRTTSGWLWV